MFLLFPLPGGGGGMMGEGGGILSYTLAICVCAAGKGMVFKGIWFGIGSSNHRKNWSSIGSCLKGSLTKD